MRVVTAPEAYNYHYDDISIFLAGGITGCRPWQDWAIEMFRERLPEDKYVLFNPRRKEFPINDPNAAGEQIRWEFRHLNLMNYFFMYFDGPTESDQPICFYELGRYVDRLFTKYGHKINEHCTICVNSAFHRKEDVIQQVQLATMDRDLVQEIRSALCYLEFRDVVDAAAARIKRIKV